MKYRRLASSRRKDIGIRKLELGLSIYSVPLHVQTHVFIFILHYCFYSYIMYASLGIRQHIHSLFVLSRYYIIYIFPPLSTDLLYLLGEWSTSSLFLLPVCHVTPRHFRNEAYGPGVYCSLLLLFLIDPNPGNSVDNYSYLLHCKYIFILFIPLNSIYVTL